MVLAGFFCHGSSFFCYGANWMIGWLPIEKRPGLGMVGAVLFHLSLMEISPMRLRALALVAILSVSVLLTASGVSMAAEPAKLLRHVVLFQFKDTQTEAQVKEVVDAFAALPKKIDVIKDFEMGTDVSVENKAAGFTHCFVVTFEDEKGRATYLPHPSHQEFVKLVGGRLEKVLVFDYWTK